MLRRLALGTLLAACLAYPALVPTTAAPAPVQKPTLVLKTTPPDGAGKAQRFVFEGTFPTSIHRAGPEHFKLTRVSDGEAINLTVDYDRESLEYDEPGSREKVKRVRATREKLVYNSLFKAIRFSLDIGRFEAKDVPHRNGQLDLYGRAKLEPGVRYRLTWACWPVGAREAAEASCDFEVSK
jgi:hypothetical protein